MKCSLCDGTGEVRPLPTVLPTTKIGKLLKAGRERKHLSLREVEGLTGLSNALISQVENGHIKNPSFYSIVSLCALYGIDALTLITESKGEKS